MGWRSNNEELQEIREFVEGMKRGTTLPTNDSLLETLRQIHDRREVPATGHDHRRLVLERLRRQMAARDGEPGTDATAIPAFLTPVVQRRRVLEWAVAASIAVHVVIGAAILPNVHVNGLFGGSEPAEVATTETVNWVALPPLNVPNRVLTPNGTPSIDERVSAEQSGHSRMEPANAGMRVGDSVPAPSSTPIGAPVATSAAPIVPTFDTGLVEGQADRNLPVDPMGSMQGPEKMRPTSDVRLSEVLSDGFSRSDDAVTEIPDVAPRLLVAPRPIYTDKALQAQIKGTVRLTVVFGADGSVRDVQVRSGLGYGLDEAAIQAVRQMKFVPGTRGGKPVSVRQRVDVSFDLR